MLIDGDKSQSRKLLIIVSLLVWESDMWDNIETSHIVVDGVTLNIIEDCEEGGREAHDNDDNEDNDVFSHH